MSLEFCDNLSFVQTAAPKTAPKPVDARGAVGTDWRKGTSLTMLACSLPSLRGQALVQGFYKERAAVGSVASQSQLTPLICSGLAPFRASDRRRWPPTLINPTTVPAPQLVSITSRRSRCTLITLDTLLSVRWVCYCGVEGNGGIMAESLLSRLFRNSFAKKNPSWSLESSEQWPTSDREYSLLLFKKGNLLL